MVYRRTKIIATLGPAVDDDETLERIINAGVNIVRLNMSHDPHAKQKKRIEQVRQIAEKCHKEIGIMIDLQGPKIRILCFKEGPVSLETGQTFILDAKLDNNDGNLHQVGIDYKDLPKDVGPGDHLLVDDGRIILEVQQVKGPQIHCQVRLGGVLSQHKGINRLGGGLSAPVLTDKDKKDLDFACEMNVDYIALSFVRSAQDVLQAREFLQSTLEIGLVTKIERVEAVENLEAIIEASDAVMVARGDLGVEMGFAELPAIQKRIIDFARRLDKAVVTATQMMESMITHPIPTRAEVSDVANAVLEGTDAVMLSAETAVGAHPVKVVECMAQVCLAAERQRETQMSGHRLKSTFLHVDQAIAMAAMYTANHMEVKAIVALTESGSTALWMSRIRSGIPIYGVSRNPKARGRMTLYRGVYPIDFDVTKFERWQMIRGVLTALREQGLVQAGERVIVTRGDITGVSGRSNSMKIVTVEPAPSYSDKRGL